MKLDLNIACQRENLRQIRAFVRKALDPYAVSDTLIYNIILAVDEACANAIIHGNNCDERKSIHVELLVEELMLYVKIYDIGAYSEERLGAYDQKSLEERINDKDKGGLGLKLIHLIMDEVAFYQKGEAYICHLTKALA